MKSTFNLRRMAILMIVFVILVAAFNSATVFWLTRSLVQKQAHQDVLNLAKDNAHRNQYHVAQIQQYITDVSATGERGGLDDAELHYKNALILLDELAVLRPQTKTQLNEARADLVAFYDVGKQMAEVYVTEGKKAGNVAMKRPQTGFDDRALTLITAMDGFIKPLEQEAITNNQSIDKETFKLPTLITLINVLSALAIILAMIYIGRKLFSQLGGEPALAQQTANVIANGDLSAEIAIKTGDSTSLLASMYKMQHNLRSLVWQIKESAESINTGAQEISAGNTNLSQRTEEQASSLEETASSMEQMASTVKQNAENAKQANFMASEASAVAIKGGQAVNQVVTTMADIHTSSKKIVDIISVIDGIAFQTNILALNAAVEAARAGEQGRGFAVVAAEVRSLAQRSATAAKEIKQLIGDSVEKVQNGSQLVAQAGETMDEIVMAVKMVTDIVNEIAAASQEQSAGIDQVNNAITNMDEVTQQNAALVEEAAAAANSLESKAQALYDATDKFIMAESRVQHQHLKGLNPEPAPELPTKSRNRLKAPKVKADEDWEEF